MVIPSLETCIINLCKILLFEFIAVASESVFYFYLGLLKATELKQSEQSVTVTSSANELDLCICASTGYSWNR